MADIKSAWEIAQKKIEKLGEPTPEERIAWRYVPEGEKLAARFLLKNINLSSQLSQYKDEANRRSVVRGMLGVLIRNINLPRDDPARKNNRRIMETVKEFKTDKVAVENVYSKMRRLFNHYTGPGEEQRKQAYEALKEEFTARFRQALQQQIGLGNVFQIDVEKRPEFHAEWRKVNSRLEGQYTGHLSEYKEELIQVD